MSSQFPLHSGGMESEPAPVTAAAGGGGAPLNSPHFTGSPTAPTPATNTNTTGLATTAFVQAQPLGWALVTNPAYGAKCDAKTVTDGAMALNGTTLTCGTSTPFVAGDVGKAIKVKGAGNAGGTRDLTTTITAFTSSSQVTLNSACLNSLGVSSANVYFGTDDTTAIQAAMTAMNAAGGGTVKVPGGTAITPAHLTPVSNVTLDLTGVIIYHCPTLNNAFIKWTNAGGTDQTNVDRFSVIGGVMVCTGLENTQQSFQNTTTLTNLTIKDTVVVGSPTASFFLTSCQNVRILNTTHPTATNTSGTNIINFVMTINGAVANAPSNLWCIGNYVTTTTVAPICITGGQNSNGSNTIPTNAIFVANNLTTTGFGCIALESGATTTNFYITQCVIALNVCKQTGGANTYGIETTNDSVSLNTDGLLHNYIVISNNYVTTGGIGIRIHASNSSITGNVVNLLDLASAQTAIAVQSHGTGHVSGNVVDGNTLLMGGTSGAGVNFNTVTASRSSNNQIIYPAGATGTVAAVIFQSSTDCQSIGDIVRGAPTRAGRLSACTDCMIRDMYTINPCSSTTTEAVLVDGAGAGNNLVKGCHIYDNRGVSAKVANAINNTGSGATCNFSDVTAIGLTGALTAGTWTSLDAGTNAQTGLVTSAVDYQILNTDSGVILTATGKTATMPTGLQAADAGSGWVVVNGSAGNCTIAVSGGGLIDPVSVINGGLNAATDIIAAGERKVLTPVGAGNLTNFVYV